MLHFIDQYPFLSILIFLSTQLNIIMILALTIKSQKLNSFYLKAAAEIHARSFPLEIEELLGDILNLSMSPSFPLWKKIIDQSEKLKAPVNPEFQPIQEALPKETLVTSSEDPKIPERTEPASNQEVSLEVSSEESLQFELATSSEKEKPTLQDRMQALEKIDEISDIDISEEPSPAAESGDFVFELEPKLSSDSTNKTQEKKT